MDIRDLIDMGKIAANNCKKSGIYSGSYYYYGEEYAEWLSLAARYLECNYPNDPDTIRFQELSTKANGRGDECFHPLMAFLNAFRKIPVNVKPTVNANPMKKEIFEILRDVFINFHKFDSAIKQRYGDGTRTTLIINDEHDLQDALYAILKLFVNDIRKEEYVPSYAGSKSRVDFFLPEQELIIETKYATKSLKEQDIGGQLIIDFNRYKELNKAKHLLCFVYDKDLNISNPQGLINDLEKLSDSDTLLMRVFISPQ